MHRIIDVRPAGGHVLQLTFAGENPVQVDLADVVRQGSVFGPLMDAVTFAQVRVGGGGRCIEWPGDIDLCADALWREAHGEVEAA